MGSLEIWIRHSGYEPSGTRFGVTQEFEMTLTLCLPLYLFMICVRMKYIMR
jgi:hypothetical protein